MNRTVLPSYKWHVTAASLLMLLLLCVCSAPTANAQQQQKKKRQPASTSPQTQGTNSSGAPGARPQPQQRKSITPLRGGDAPQGSRVTVTSDVALNDYSAYKSGDRYYVVIPKANAPGAQSMRGRGYEDVQIQKRGDDAVISFHLQPGTAAHVNQKFNRLEVVFDTPGGKKPADNTGNAGSAHTSEATRPNAASSQSAQGNAGGNNQQTPATNTRLAPGAATVQGSGNQSVNPALNRGAQLNAEPASQAPTPTMSPATGEPALSQTNSSELTPSPAPSAAQMTEQIAQARSAPSVPSAVTTTQASSGVSLGATLARNWLVLLLAGLILLSVILFVVMRPRAEDRAALPPQRVKAVAGSAAGTALVDDAESELTATPVAEQVLTSAMVAPNRMTDEAVGLEDELQLASDETLAAEPVLADTGDGASVEHVEAELKNLLAGEAYDEELVGATDAGTRQLVAAGLLAALASRNQQWHERARAAFIKHGYFEEATRDLRTAAAPAERASAARNLGHVSDLAATPHLVAALEDPAKEVRRAAIGALEVLRDPAAIIPLNRLLEREKNRKKNKRIDLTLIKRAIEASAVREPVVAEETQTPVAATPAPEAAEEATQVTEAAPIAEATPLAEATPPAEAEATTTEAESIPAEIEATTAEVEALPFATVEDVPATGIAGEQLMLEDSPSPPAVAGETRHPSGMETDALVAGGLAAIEGAGALAGVDEAESVDAREKEETARRAFEEEERRRVEEETRQRAEAETTRRQAAEAARLHAEAEARERQETEAREREEAEERERQAVEARQRKEEETARLRAAEEAEQQRLAEATRLQAEEEEARREAEEARLQAEEQARQHAAAEEARLAAEARAAEEAHLAEEARIAEKARIAEEARLAEEARQQREEAEAEARRVAEERSARERALEAARLRAEEEARQHEEEEARRREEEAARLRAAAEAREREETEAREREEVEARQLAEAEAARREFAEIESGSLPEAEVIEEPARPFVPDEVFEHEGLVEPAGGEETPYVTPAADWFASNRDAQGDWFDVDISEAPDVTSTEMPESVSQSLAFDEELTVAEPIRETGWPTPSVEDMTGFPVQESIEPESSYTERAIAPGSSVKDIELAVTDKGMEMVEEDLSMVPTTILRRLGSDVATMRAAAVSDLGRLGGDEAFREITGAFDDPVQIVRDAAARALYAIEPDRAASFTRALREATPERRHNIGEALASSGLAAEAISNLMGESREKTYDAFSLLFLMSKAGEVRPLMRAIEEHPNNEVRLAVVKLLALSGQQDILPAFRRLAVRGSLPTEVRSAVMEAIYQLSSQTSSDTSSVA